MGDVIAAVPFEEGPMITPLRGIVRSILAILSVFGPCGGACRGDAIYSVTNLGPGDPNQSSYLSALNPSDQGAFKAGSFDVFAHPPTVPPQPGYNIPYSGNSIYGQSMVTSNNLGLNAGTVTEYLSLWGTAVKITTAYQGGGGQSPGLYGWVPSSQAPMGYFWGTIAGINDHSIMAVNEYQYLTKGPQADTVPYLVDSSSLNHRDQYLGSLGVTGGMANALNNSNQVVGWSQLANGVQHAFVYSNGAMRDLNLEIPPASGIVLTDAVGIDSSGRIVAFGTDSSGTTSEFLLTPTAVPEPSTLAFICLCGASLATRRRLSERLLRP